MFLTYAEYIDRSINPSASEELFSKLERLAGMTIDAFCFSAITRYNLSEHSMFAEDIKNAVALQIDYIVKCGGIDAYLDSAGKSEASHSVAVGDVSENVSFRQDSSPSAHVTNGGMKVAPMAVPLLASVRAVGRMV